MCTFSRLRILSCATAAWLLSLTTAQVAGAQAPPPPGLRCGARSAIEYAVVLDASSSLTDEPVATRARKSYTGILELISGVLCPSDRLWVYTFAPGPGSETPALDSFGPGEVSRDSLARLAGAALRQRTRHSDLSVVLPRILRDIYRQTSVKTTFLVTDGSYYPYRRGARSWKIDDLTRRLNDLADSVESFPRDTAHQFHVIGVNSESARAVDTALVVDWPPRRDDRLWRHGGATLDLRRARGDSLLSLLFGDHFQGEREFSLWRVLAGGPDAAWPVLAGYTTELGGPLSDFANDSVEHLVYLPPSGFVGRCPEVRARDVDDRLRTQAVDADLHAGLLCSLATPGRAEMDALAKLGVARFALVQPSRLRITGYSAGIYGLHEVVVSENGAACDSALSARRFARGEAWPSSSTVAAELDLTQVGSTARSSVGLIRFDESGCLAPDSLASKWRRMPGDYVLTVHGRNGGSVQRRTIRAPRIELLRLNYRPGGFPFPEDRLALLAICVGVRRPFAGYEQVHVNIDTVRKELTAEGAKHACRNVTVDTATTVLRGYSGVFLLKTAGVSVARVYTDAGERSRSDPPRDWIPVELEPDGWLFLPWATLALAALAGALVQLAYLKHASRNERHRLSLLALLSALISIVISAALVVVTVELASIIANRYLRGAIVPAPFLILLLAYGVRVFAAVLVPEELEDDLLDPGAAYSDAEAARRLQHEHQRMKAVLWLIGIFFLTLLLEWAAGCDGGEMTASVVIFFAVLASEAARAKARSVWSDRLWLSVVLGKVGRWLSAKFPHLHAHPPAIAPAPAGSPLTTGVLQADTPHAFSLPIAVPPEANDSAGTPAATSAAADAAPAGGAAEGEEPSAVGVDGFSNDGQRWGKWVKRLGHWVREE